MAADKGAIDVIVEVVAQRKPGIAALRIFAVGGVLHESEVSAGDLAEQLDLFRIKKLLDKKIAVRVEAGFLFRRKGVDAHGCLLPEVSLSFSGALLCCERYLRSFAP